MKVRPDREMKNLISELSTVTELFQAREWAKARELLLRGLALAKERGLPYPHLAWQLCVALDNLGETEEALRMAVEAVDQDPLVPDHRRSFLFIAERLREQVSQLLPEDPSIARLHALLAAEDAAEEDTHLAMARHLLTGGNLARAKELLEAVTTLSPHCTEAWQLLMEVNAALGDEEARSLCEFEALACQNATDAALEARTQLAKRSG